jgi:hypothetical protein
MAGSRNWEFKVTTQKWSPGMSALFCQCLSVAHVSREVLVVLHPSASIHRLVMMEVSGYIPEQDMDIVCTVRAV